MTTVSFDWQGLQVTADCCIGTTPPSGPDPTYVDEFTFTLGGIPLPEWLQAELNDTHSDDLVRKAIDEAGYKGDD